MFKKLKHKLLAFKRVAGIEIVLMPAGKFIFNLSILSVNKNLVNTEKKEPNIDSFEKLKDLIPPGIPISLIVNGRGVLHKKISELNDKDESSIMSTVLAGAKFADFYLQKFEAGNNTFLSIIRRDSLAQLLEQFKNHKLIVINVSIGAYAAINLIPLIKTDAKAFNFSGHTFEIKDNILSEYKQGTSQEEKFYKIGEENISDNLLISYAGAFQLIFPLGQEINLEVEEVKSQNEEFKNKEIFKVAGFSLMGVFFVILFINYILFSHYRARNEELLTKNSMYIGMLKEVEFFEKQVEEKEYFLKNAGWLTTPKTSYYSDQIAQLVPSSIKLSELKINPINKRRSQKERRNIFQSDTILISGTCTNPTVLNPWMKNIKSKNWVNSASNLNYVYDSKTKSGKFEVEIKAGNEF